MLARTAPIRRSFAIVAAAGLLVLASCGSDDGLGRRYSVSGSVTYNDKPLEKGVISFVPEDSKGIGANGVVENGAYAMSTAGDRDGVRSGKYKVTITAKEDTYAKAQEDYKKFTKQENPGTVPAQFLTKAAAKAKNFIPAGYGDVRSTNLTAEVREQANSIDFKLSDADAPPDPKAAGKGRGK
jgi:hypothetical protein